MDLMDMDLLDLESQIQMRARLDSAMTDRAYAKLAASVTSAAAAPRVTHNDLEQVDSAAKACLSHLGVEPGNVPQGVKDPAERLDYLCRPSGTMRRKVRLDGAWYTDASGAMLARLDTGETVALLPRALGGYAYVDPATGAQVRVNKNTAARIQGEATLLYKPLPNHALGVRDLLIFIFSVFEVHDYLLVLAAAVVATLVGMLPAWANQALFSVVIPSGQEALIAPIAALLVGVAASTVIIGACRNLVTQRVAIKMQVAAEAAAFSRLLTLPTGFFKGRSGGELGMRVSQVSLLAQNLATVILGAGLTALLALAYLVQVAFFAPSLVAPAFTVVFIQIAVTLLAMYFQARFDRLSMEAQTKLSGTVTSMLNGIQKLKLAGAEDRAFAQWADGYAGYAKSAYNRPPLVIALPVLGAVVGTFGIVAIYVSAAAAQVSVADYMAFNAAYGQLTAAVLALMSMSVQVSQIRPMLDMVAPILEAEPEIAQDKPSVSELSGAIEVSNVSFRYGPDDPWVLRDLSFRVRPGEYVALVGKSGCGKSTIMRLLLGFEEPERGMVTYGPHDASKVDATSLRRHIGVVTQSGRLFMGDIASNITISTPTATLDDAWAAAELAGIADDIRKMPMGMQTMVTEGGGGISGGQRQRIMIARAICGAKRILMFDEATSALDNVSQKHVSDSLDSLNCTRLVVAHRLSTVRHCDRIMVVDGGRIAEEGTYEELIERGGIFAELVARQRLDDKE